MPLSVLAPGTPGPRPAPWPPSSEQRSPGPCGAGGWRWQAESGIGTPRSGETGVGMRCTQQQLFMGVRRVPRRSPTGADRLVLRGGGRGCTGLARGCPQRPLDQRRAGAAVGMDGRGVSLPVLRTGQSRRLAVRPSARGAQPSAALRAGGARAMAGHRGQRGGAAQGPRGHRAAERARPPDSQAAREAYARCIFDGGDPAPDGS